MIFLAPLGIIFGVYLSTTLLRRNQKAVFHRLQENKQAKVLKPPDTEQDDSAWILAEHQHHFKVSSVALVTTSLGSFLYPPLGLLSLGLITYSAVPMLNHAAHSLYNERKIKNDSFSAIVSILCVGTGNFFAASVQNWIYHLGSRLVGESKQHSTQLTTEAFARKPDRVWVLENSVEIQIPLHKLRQGDVVIVRTCEVIPVDGVIEEGAALLDQQVLTGEICPVERTIGDDVMASSLVVNGRLWIRTKQSGEETQAHKLHELLHQTTDFKTDLQLKGEAWSDRVSLPLLVVSAVTLPLAGVAPATALLFSAPTNTVRALLSLQTSTHMQWAAEQGIFIKDGRVLEELPFIDMVLFDKTGTLTQSKPEVGQIICCGLDSMTLLTYAAAAEQHLQHPIAIAIVDKAAELGLSLPEVWDSHFVVGRGIQVTIGGREVHVGSQRFVQEISSELHLPFEIEHVMRMTEGHSFVFIAVERKIRGAIELYPRLRPEVPQVINELRERGMHSLAVVSGDQAAPTERLANSLGIAAFSQILPHEKAALIENLQRQGHKVCFVGDGVNDALAMKQANVSICMASGADITSEVAQIVLVNDDLSHLRDVFDMAIHLQIRLGGSLAFWTGFGLFNAISVPLFSFGPLESSLLYGLAFGMGFKHAKSPGWLDRPGRHPEQYKGNTLEQVEWKVER